MFTDICQSTATRVRVGEERAERWIHRLDRISHACVESSGGRVVKGLGDGLLAVFESASTALSSAARLQQRVASAADSLLGACVRIGVACGDIVIRDGDVRGLPVVIAARLCEVASPSSIVVTATTIDAAQGRLAFPARLLEPVRLRGLSSPIAVQTVQWQNHEEPTATIEDAVQGSQTSRAS